MQLYCTHSVSYYFHQTMGISPWQYVLYFNSSMIFCKSFYSNFNGGIPFQRGMWCGGKCTRQGAERIVLDHSLCILEWLTSFLWIRNKIGQCMWKCKPALKCTEVLFSWDQNSLQYTEDNTRWLSGCVFMACGILWDSCSVLLQQLTV